MPAPRDETLSSTRALSLSHPAIFRFIEPACANPRRSILPHSGHPGSTESKSETLGAIMPRGILSVGLVQKYRAGHTLPAPRGIERLKEGDYLWLLQFRLMMSASLG